MKKKVNAWIENVVIPTYPIGKPEKNPMYFEKRVYQGSSGVVYPNAIVEKIYDIKIDKTYKAVFLENDYIKIMILPELGGRIQMAWDKIRKRHFVYYNQVIKPALVGLTGPWISGGIEFNWPQHHRPSTFEPVDFTIRENSDGSKTVWVNEIERMFRTKGMAGFTLYPGKAYLEIKGKLYNRTALPQTFLWWANPAVKVNDYYQSVFPPDVYAVFDHGKRDVSSFPIATGIYYKVDYAPGTDISWYKNIPVPTSYMAIKSKYDFIGGYEHDTKAGLLHVADHHISPGKKQWTWGNGDFGKAWERNLTDEDGPYIELMTGVYTDNQPDFSWLQPYEEKTFDQYFMPYHEVGMVKNATKEALLGFMVNEGSVKLKVYVTSEYPGAKIKLLLNNVLINESVSDLSPENIFEKSIGLGSNVSSQSFKVIVEDTNGNELVNYQTEKKESKEIPPSVTAAKHPSDISTVEQLYLNGLHLEQYRHATFKATDYYEEALRREPGDMRNNNALGLWYLRRAQFEKAETYFRTAISTLTSRNPNPYEGEPYYNLGLVLKMQDRLDEAYEAFFKATWNGAWQDSAFFSLARIASARGVFKEALQLIDKSLLRNYHSHSARHLKVILLRKLGMYNEAVAFNKESISIDPFNYGCYFETYLLLKQHNNKAEAEKALCDFRDLMGDNYNYYIEYALDYTHAGLYEEANELLQVFTAGRTDIYPMILYYMGWNAEREGKVDEAQHCFKQAGLGCPDYCFPNRIEDVMALKSAISFNGDVAKAYYYLGNFWYDKRQYKEAIACWESSVVLDDKFATVHRNLALAYYNKQKNVTKAILFLEKAFELDVTDGRVFMELDQLYKKVGKPYEERLELLESYPLLVEFRDDLYLEKITLYNHLKHYEVAKELITKRKFHPWEGGEGKVVRQFLVCHIELAKQLLLKKEYQNVLTLLAATDQFPHNLGEGKLYGVQENDINYLRGCSYKGLNMQQDAIALFRKATIGISEPVQAVYYNDPQPDKIFYQSLAWMKLGDMEKAKQILQRFIAFGENHMNDEMEIDYFAVSLPDLLIFETDLNESNKVHCNYLIGLGYLGLGNYIQAEEFLKKVLQMNPYHQGAQTHLNMFAFLQIQHERSALINPE